MPLQPSAVYGPVHSRRLGNSLGINVLPLDAKFCLSNCIYCQYGATDIVAMQKSKIRPAGELLEEIENSFKHISLGRTQIDSITFSGNGEPTLHPEIDDLIQGVKKFRNRYFPAIPISILSDSSRVYLPQVRAALEELDECYMKLDAGSLQMYERMNRPMGNPDWSRMIEGLSRMPQVTIQSLFISEPVNNASAESVRGWLTVLERVRPSGLHIYTVSRDTADPRVRPVGAQRLKEIAYRACEAADLSVLDQESDTFVELV